MGSVGGGDKVGDETRATRLYMKHQVTALSANRVALVWLRSFIPSPISHPGQSSIDALRGMFATEWQRRYPALHHPLELNSDATTKPHRGQEDKHHPT